MTESQIELTPAAQERLQNLRQQYIAIRQEKNLERLSQIKHMAQSIKKGETYYVYDFDKF